MKSYTNNQYRKSNHFSRSNQARPSSVSLPIPVGVSNAGLNYISEKSITLNELMRIKDVCRSHPSDHYMLTPSAIQHLGIKTDGSTIEAYTPPNSSEIRSFVKCVLPKTPKGIGTQVKNWIVFKISLGRPVHYPEIFHFLQQEFNINPLTQEKFPEIVQRIYNAIFVSLCKVSLKRTNRPGKNSHWIKDLSKQDQQEISANYFKMKTVPRGPKRVKLSNDYDSIHNYNGKPEGSIIIDEKIQKETEKEVNKSNNDNGKFVEKEINESYENIIEKETEMTAP